MKKGEIEYYVRGTKQHLGGFDPYNKSRMISPPKPNRVPNGGWKIKTSKFIKKSLNLLDDFSKSLKTLSPFDFFPTFLIPYQIEGYNQYNNSNLIL